MKTTNQLSKYELWGEGEENETINELNIYTQNANHNKKAQKTSLTLLSL